MKKNKRKLVRLWCNVTEEVEAEIIQMAEVQDITQSQVVRHLLRRGLAAAKVDQLKEAAQ